MKGLGGMGDIARLMKQAQSQLKDMQKQMREIEETLKRFGKTYEFHVYENAGHGFFSVDRPSYRSEAAVKGWKKVFDFFGRYLS